MLKPPVARRIPRLEIVNGDRRQDDYAWLRDKDDPAVRAHLEAENAYTDTVMTPTAAFQDALYREMLARIKEDDQSVPYRKGGHVYYSRTETGKQYPILCRRRAGGGVVEAPEEVTLDLNRLAEGHAFLALGAYAASDDGRSLAYSLDVTGFREYALHVKDLETGTQLPDRIDKVSSAAWSADSSVLFYVTEDEAKRAYRLWRHRLGAPHDDLLYEETDELFRLHVTRSRSGEFLFASSRSFTTSEVRYLRADAPTLPWRVLRAREHDHEYDVDHGGDVFFVRTNAGGRRNFRLVTVPVADPRPEQWTELLAHREEVMLEDVDVFAGHYVVTEREDGLLRLRVTERRTGEVHDIEFPEPTYDLSPEPNLVYATSVYRFRYQSFVTPSSVFDYEMDERRLTLLKQTEVRGYDRTRYRSERLHATAADGTRIPISLVSRADTARDGSGALLLAGYGAYGLSYPVTFSSSRLSLLDRGVSFAIAHVRGGGELGKRWHDAGRMLAKRNTFTDFIAAADFLIAQGVTARDRLVIEGGSAGGLLIGAVLNERAEVCAAAILRVPFVDVINTMLDESLPLTVGEFEEWGNPKIEEQYEYMKTYCPYTNVAARGYPAMLVRTSLNDSQVMYWEPAKYVAKLRATVPPDPARPLLFKINLDAGHGGASGRYDALREAAFDFAYILSRLGRMEGAPVSAPVDGARLLSERPAPA
jgi:oligopeptidase B